jgi:hypothetical protein
MAVRTSMATRVPGRKSVGSSTASPPPLKFAVRPRQARTGPPVSRVTRTGRFKENLECRRSLEPVVGRPLRGFAAPDFPFD